MPESHSSLFGSDEMDGSQSVPYDRQFVLQQIVGVDFVRLLRFDHPAYQYSTAVSYLELLFQGTVVHSYGHPVLLGLEEVDHVQRQKHPLAVQLQLLQCLLLADCPHYVGYIDELAPGAYGRFIRFLFLPEVLLVNDKVHRQN